MASLRNTQTRNTCSDSQQEKIVTVLIENPSKSCCHGPLIRCCAAFGISQIFVIGYDQCSVQGSHGSSKHVELVAFPTHETAVECLVTQEGFMLIGLLNGASDAFIDDFVDSNEDSINESNSRHCKSSACSRGFLVARETVFRNISKEQQDAGAEEIPKEEDTFVRVISNKIQNSLVSSKESAPTLKITEKKSFPASCRQFAPRTCLVIGKKSKGLSWSLAQHCHSFIHVPHLGCDSYTHMKYRKDSENQFPPSVFSVQRRRPWLTLESSLSIVLHEFTTWACYNDHDYRGQKYHVKRIDKGTLDDPDAMQKKQDARKQKRQIQKDEVGEMESQANNMDFLNILEENGEGDY